MSDNGIPRWAKGDFNPELENHQELVQYIEDTLRDRKADSSSKSEMTVTELAEECSSVFSWEEYYLRANLIPYALMWMADEEEVVQNNPRREGGNPTGYWSIDE